MNNNNQQSPQDEQLNNMSKNMANKGSKAVKKGVKKTAKMVLKAIKKLVMLIIKAILIPLLPYILGLLLVMFLVYIAWYVIFDGRGKSKNYQEEDATQYNEVAKDNKGDISATELSEGNKITQAFYTYYSQKSIWVIVKDEGVDKPMQYNSPEFIKKFGENGLHDKYEREKMFYLNPNALWSLDRFLNKNKFKFPEQFVKPVYHDEETYELKDLTDKDNKLVAESHKWNSSSREFYEDKKEKGVWDYGFGSILNYKKFKEEAKKEGTYSEINIWDKEEQKIKKVSIQEAKALVAQNKDRYEGFDGSYENKQYSENCPEESKEVYMIDQVTSPTGFIKNNIVQEWVDTGKPFNESSSYETSVSIKKERMVQGKNDAGQLLYLDENGNETTDSKKVEKITDADGKESEKVTEYKKKMVKETYYEKEKRTFRAFVKGTIQKYEAKYDGNPDTSQLKGGKYFEDYMANYKTYVPDNVMGDFNFKDRTGKQKEELLDLLKTQPFGETDGSSSSGGDGGSFKAGAGATGSDYANALQFLPTIKQYAEKAGVDPALIIALICAESSGNPNCDNGSAYGLMQWEYGANGSNIDIHYKDGSTEKLNVTKSSLMGNIDLQIKSGIAELQKNIDASYNNIPAMFVGYNFGTGGLQYTVKHYLQTQGKGSSNADVVNYLKTGDGGWLSARKWYSTGGYREIHAGGGGTWDYFERILKNYKPLDGSKGPWIINSKGEKVEFDLSTGKNTVTGGAGTPVGGGSVIDGIANSVSNAISGITDWISNAWSVISKNIKDLFPETAVPLSKTSTEFNGQVKENQIQTYIKMMFVMDEGKYLTEYDDFNNDDWKQRYALLFKNPLGTGWSSLDNPGTVNLNNYFKDGFVAPLKMDKLTISSPFTNSHQGIDIVAPEGTDVLAVADGTVEETGTDTQKGQFVIISHSDGVKTGYYSLKDISVKKGDAVTKGQVIAKSGTSKETNNSIHFELIKNNTKEDASWMVTGSFVASDYNMSEDDAETIRQVLALAKQYIGYQYVWGGKGEMIDSRRLSELKSSLGASNYPLSDSAYIGKQGFDCSGYVSYLYKKVTGGFIGASTTQQEAMLQNYKVSMSNLQPGDLIFNDHHVVLYEGNGMIINSSNSQAYPKGGVKESHLYSGLTRAYRPIAFLKNKHK